MEARRRLAASPSILKLVSLTFLLLRFRRISLPRHTCRLPFRFQRSITLDLLGSSPAGSPIETPGPVLRRRRRHPWRRVRLVSDSPDDPGSPGLWGSPSVPGVGVEKPAHYWPPPSPLPSTAFTT